MDDKQGTLKSFSDRIRARRAQNEGDGAPKLALRPPWERLVPQGPGLGDGQGPAEVLVRERVKHQPPAPSGRKRKL